MGYVGLAVLAFVVYAVPVALALRKARWFEAAGWSAMGLLVAAVFTASTMALPRWLTGTLIGAAVVVWAPLAWISLRRRFS